MTGRQFTRLVFYFTVCAQCKAHGKPLSLAVADCRVGVPGVFGDSSTTGLPLNETTVADQVLNWKKLFTHHDHTDMLYLTYFTRLSSRKQATPRQLW